MDNIANLNISRKTHVTKNPRAKAKWNQISLIVKLSRTVKHNSSLLLASGDKTMSGKYLA